jgi:hypothetical protein
MCLWERTAASKTGAAFSASGRGGFCGVGSGPTISISGWLASIGTSVRTLAKASSILLRTAATPAPVQRVRRWEMSSLRHRHPGFLNAVEDRPNKTMFNRDSVSKHLTTSGKIFVNPKESGGRDWAKQKDAAVIFADEVWSDWLNFLTCFVCGVHGSAP